MTAKAKNKTVTQESAFQGETCEGGGTKNNFYKTLKKYYKNSFIAKETESRNGTMIRKHWILGNAGLHDNICTFYFTQQLII